MKEGCRSCVIGELLAYGIARKGVEISQEVVVVVVVFVVFVCICKARPAGNTASDDVVRREERALQGWQAIAQRWEMAAAAADVRGLTSRWERAGEGSCTLTRLCDRRFQVGSKFGSDMPEREERRGELFKRKRNGEQSTE